MGNPYYIPTESGQGMRNAGKFMDLGVNLSQLKQRKQEHEDMMPIRERQVAATEQGVKNQTDELKMRKEKYAQELGEKNAVTKPLGEVEMLNIKAKVKQVNKNTPSGFNFEKAAQPFMEQIEALTKEGKSKFELYQFTKNNSKMITSRMQEEALKILSSDAPQSEKDKVNEMLKLFDDDPTNDPEHLTLAQRLFPQSAKYEKDQEELRKAELNKMNRTGSTNWANQQISQNKLDAMNAYLEGSATPEQERLINVDGDPLLSRAAQMVASDFSLMGLSADERAMKVMQIADLMRGASNTGPGKIKGGGKTLDQATAAQYLQKAGGDKNKARELAKQDGYTF